MLKKLCIVIFSLYLTACQSLRPQHEYSVILKDKVIALGTIEQQRQQNIVFTGEHYHYIAQQGGDQILKIIQTIPPEKRTLVNTLPLEFELHTPNNFGGVLSIRYEVPIVNLDLATRQQLKQLGFTQQTTHCRSATIPIEQCEYPLAEIHFSGQIYQKSMDQTAPAYRLKTAYPMVLYQIKVQKKSKAKVAKDLASATLMAPLVVVGAIIYVPIVLISGTIAGNDGWH